ncbi:MAG TPA: hypothetical protein VL244_12490 [Alphaproteobacteria bacterium]|nr:hypothetical protein [Alphaproteobacteria bacterium]
MARSTSAAAAGRRHRPHGRLLGAAALLGLLVELSPLPAAHAYTAAGDRIFVPTLLLPQIAPSDEFYLTFLTQHPTAGSRLDNLNAVYNKTITERLSVGVADGYSWLTPKGPDGRQNLQTTVKYLAVLEPADEFLLSTGVAREWGGSGATGSGVAAIGASPKGATTPALTFGKGLGEIGPAYLRPFAVTGLLGYQVSDGAPRPDRWQIGVSLEYSLPYLESKVTSTELPDVVRALTPMVEVLLATPSGASYGYKTTITVAPGVSYAGGGWELGVEALVPATRATGSGVGAAVQLHLSLDYLLAGGFLGRPILSAP